MSKEDLARYLMWLEAEGPKISRRQMLKAGALVALGLAGCAPEATPEPTAEPTKAPDPTTPPEPTEAPPPTEAPAVGGGEVIVCSWGGGFQDTQRQDIFTPFEEATGIKVNDVSAPDNSKLKAMVDSGNVEWDVFTSSMNTYRELGPDYFEAIDYGMYPQEQRDNLFEESKHEYAVGSIVFAVVNTYRTDAYPTGEHPKNWTEFFDPDLFPGPRTLYASSGIPSHTLEHALMADGVPMDELYPLDVDRAFAVLDKVKPHVVKWWDSGAIPVQMLADNEVVLATAYNGRAQALIDEGVPIAIEWNGGTMNQDFWFIVKNSPNPENAQKFVQFATQGDVQGEFAKHYAYGPANALAYEYLSEERAAVLPTNPDLVAKMMFRNEDWWAENREAMVERFAEWLLE